MIVYILIVLCSFFLSVSIVLIEKNFFNLEDVNLRARQASHLTPTSRLGGIAILISSAVFSLILTGFNGWELFVTVSPLFLAGLFEDIGFKSSPRIRLLVAGVCSAVAIYLYQAWLSNIDTVGVDWLLSFPIVGILFTIFAIVGLINAINLIDGVNGLACGQVMISAFCISILATNVGENNISTLALVIAFSTLGVFLINYPFGYLFLGDAGAYTLGFLLAWMLVLLSHRQPQLSDWSLLCLIIWPVFDTFLAIIRRKFMSRSPGSPDRLHFHQVIMRASQIMSKGRISKKMANPLATTIILPMAVVPAIGGVIYSHDSKVSFVIVISAIMVFSGIYFSISHLVKNGKKRKAIIAFMGSKT